MQCDCGHPFGRHAEGDDEVATCYVEGCLCTAFERADVVQRNAEAERDVAQRNAAAWETESQEGRTGMASYWRPRAEQAEAERDVLKARVEAMKPVADAALAWWGSRGHPFEGESAAHLAAAAARYYTAIVCEALAATHDARCWSHHGGPCNCPARYAAAALAAVPPA